MESCRRPVGTRSQPRGKGAPARSANLGWNRLMHDCERTAMSFDDVVRGRRSIRGFKRERVPKEAIKSIIEIAMRAPSSLNTQPWNFYVIAGEPLDRIRAGNTERNLAGVPSSREFRSHGDYTGAHRERQIGIAKQLFAAMGIERHDQEKRKEWVLRGFRQFDAPVSIVVTYPWRRHRAFRLRRGHQCPGECGVVARPGLRHQQPGNHAIAGGSGARRYPGRSGHHDLRRDGISRRDVSGQRGGVAPQDRGRGGHICRLRRLTGGAAPCPAARAGPEPRIRRSLRGPFPRPDAWPSGRPFAGTQPDHGETEHRAPAPACVRRARASWGRPAIGRACPRTR